MSFEDFTPYTHPPPPELFDQDLAGSDFDFPFNQDAYSLLISYESLPIISTPSLTYSTDEATSSYYSSDYTQYSFPPEIPSGIDSSLNNGLYGAHVPNHPAVFSNDMPFIQPPHPAEAQFDTGSSDPSPNACISPEDLSIAAQPPTCVVPPLPVHVTPNSEAQKAPALDRPFQCPHCPHASKRKYNLDTHIKARHDKLKPFECSTCGYRFGRKNDLKRHWENPSTHQKHPKAPLRSQS